MKLTLQDDCNLVVSDAAGKPQWQSKTAIPVELKPVCRLTLQEDGNLVLCHQPLHAAPVAIWNTDAEDVLTRVGVP